MAQLITAGTAALLASDISVEILPRWLCRFRGTRAQLIAEGLIPDDFKWPTRTQTTKWESGRFEYWTERCRPQGTKGPQSVWTEGDYWVLDISIKGRSTYADHLIHQKTLELAAIVCSSHPETQKTWWRAHEARKDEKYMAFRTRALGDFVQRKRGRPSKTVTAEQSQGASA